MTINLNPAQQQVIDLAIQSGAFRDPAEVLDHALEIIREQLDWETLITEDREKFASQIANGFAQAERGELADADSALATLRQRRLESAPRR